MSFRPRISGKPWRGESLLEDDLAVIFVHWRSKDAATHDIEKFRRIDTGFAKQSESFGQRFERRSDRKVSRQLENIRLPRLIADDFNAAAHGFERRHRALNGVASASRHDHELGGRGCVRTSKNGSGNKLLAGFLVRHCQTLRESAAYGALRNVKTAFRQRCKNSARTENHRLKCRIVRHHRMGNTDR